MDAMTIIGLGVIIAAGVTGLAALLPPSRNSGGIEASLRERERADWRRGEDGPTVSGQFGHYVGLYGKGRKS